MTPYILTEAAEADIRGIIHYARGQWGPHQARRYLTLLEQGIVLVATGKGIFRDMSAIYPALRMAHCQHHYIFCLPRKDASSLIVAVLHERMDLIVRVAGRLNSQAEVRTDI